VARQLLTVDEAAVYLNVTPRFVRRLVQERRIAFARLGRHVRLDVRDLDEFVAAGRVEEAPRRLRMVPGRPAG
jgi:excisionase family DNA binding protein